MALKLTTRQRSDFAKMDPRVAMTCIVQGRYIAQGQPAVSEEGLGGFSRNSRSHNGRLSAGRLRKGRDWHGLADHVDRVAWATDHTDPGGWDPGGAVTDHQYLAGRGRWRNIRTYMANVVTARRHLHGLSGALLLSHDGTCRDGARTIGARPDQGENLPAVLLYWPSAARCTSGAARFVVID